MKDNNQLEALNSQSEFKQGFKYGAASTLLIALFVFLLGMVVISANNLAEKELLLKTFVR